jgi:hypothetical protein
MEMRASHEKDVIFGDGFDVWLGQPRNMATMRTPDDKTIARHPQDGHLILLA